MNKTPKPIYDGTILEIEGMHFKLSLARDDYMGEPWKENDGHGDVTGWEHRDKCPGEMILVQDRGSKRFYDFAGAVRLARKEGWNTAPYTFATKGEQAHAAALADYNHLRGWCADEWEWCVVGVTLLDDYDQPISGMTEYLGGVESNDYAGIRVAAAELAEQIVSDYISMFGSIIEPHEELSGDEAEQVAA